MVCDWFHLLFFWHAKAFSGRKENEKFNILTTSQLTVQVLDIQYNQSLNIYCIPYSGAFYMFTANSLVHKRFLRMKFEAKLISSKIRASPIVAI